MSGKDWTPDEVRELRRMYGSRTDSKIARALKRPVAEVKAKALELALAKNKRAFPGTRKMPRWSSAELEQLKGLYPNLPNSEIARRLGRSEKSVATQGARMFLRKSGERLADMGLSNVQLRRDRASKAC